ncbi:hypothetical protein AB3S75_023785 [Citrus x aurantiifolia]
MSKDKEKVIEIDDDELDFLPNLLAEPAFDPKIPLELVRPSSIRSSARRMSSEVTTSPSNSNDEGSSSSKETISENPGEESGEASSLKIARLEKTRKLSNRTLIEHYPIDLMTCITTIDNLKEFRTVYNIPDGIDLRIPGKKDTPSRPPKGYVTLFL